jgi:hypothetical protein
MPIADGTARPNDVRSLEAGTLLLGAGAILLLVSLFLEWYQPGIDAWEIFEVWDLVLAGLAIGALVATASRFGVGVVRPPSWTFGPATAALVIVVYAFLDPPPLIGSPGVDGDPSTGLWLALAAAVLMSAGAVMSVARISVAFNAAGPAAAGDPAGRHHATAADPAAADPYIAGPGGVVPPAAPGKGPGGLFTRRAGGNPVDPGDPAAPGAVPPTEPTRRL